jgi:tetratricopeptide (TPR) repeat protein
VINIIFQWDKFLIIPTIFLIYTICLISPTITNSTLLIEETKLMQRAYDSLNEGEIADALQLYDEILKENPTHIHALNYKGLALASLGHYEEAIQWYDKVLNIDPNDTDAKYNKNIALLSVNKSTEPSVLYDAPYEPHQ